jgi:hypothetical protein
MRLLLVTGLVGLLAVGLRAEESTTTTMRQKLLAKVLELASAPPPQKKIEEKSPTDSTVVKMESFTVIEPTRRQCSGDSM